MAIRLHQLSFKGLREFEQIIVLPFPRWKQNSAWKKPAVGYRKRTGLHVRQE